MVQYIDEYGKSKYRKTIIFIMSLVITGIIFGVIYIFKDHFYFHGHGDPLKVKSPKNVEITVSPSYLQLVKQLQEVEDEISVLKDKVKSLESKVEYHRDIIQVGTAMEFVKILYAEEMQRLIKKEGKEDVK